MLWQKTALKTIVFSGHFDGHQLFNEDKVLLHTGNTLPGWKYGSRIWWIWLTGHQPCRLTLQRIYFVVQKGNKEEKNSNRNSWDIVMWMSCLFFFTVQCPLSGFTWANQSCSWPVVASALCERYFFSQQPYSADRYVKRNLVGKKVLSNM